MVAEAGGEMMSYSIESVAAALGKDPQTIRILLQRGMLPFGIAYKRSEGNKNYDYILFPEKIREYIGEDFQQAERIADRRRSG